MPAPPLRIFSSLRVGGDTTGGDLMTRWTALALILGACQGSVEFNPDDFVGTWNTDEITYEDGRVEVLPAGGVSIEDEECEFTSTLTFKSGGVATTQLLYTQISDTTVTYPEDYEGTWTEGDDVLEVVFQGDDLVFEEFSCAMTKKDLMTCSSEGDVMVLSRAD
jgi:hypothetical protein